MKQAFSIAMTDLVHGNLAALAGSSPNRIAIAEGSSGITFAALYEAVLERSRSLVAARAPAVVFVDAAASISLRLIDFLGVVHSGRCAAVDDPDWPEALRQTIRTTIVGESSALAHAAPESDFYIGFTSGSTGMPKGFMRSHESWTTSFRVCLEAFGPAVMGRILAPGGMSHSLFLFGMLLAAWSGGGVIVQAQFSAPRSLEILALGDTPGLVAVPSQLLMMLEHAHRRGLPPNHEVRLIMISGARWPRQRTPELRALFPQARIVEFYGASETSFVAWMDADEHAPDIVVGTPFEGVEVDIRHQQASEGTGLIFVRSRMLFNRYVGGSTDATAAIREEGGWLSVRDMGYFDAEGRLCLVGRENRMIVTAGRNLFPEEIETCLVGFPGVAAASVQGVPDAVRGMQVVAWIQPEPGVGDDAVASSELAAWCRERLAPYKVPRQFYICRNWAMTSSGKTDHRALATQGNVIAGPNA